MLPFHPGRFGNTATSDGTVLSNTAYSNALEFTE
jgi:hypothetical protein